MLTCITGLVVDKWVNRTLWPDGGVIVLNVPDSPTPIVPLEASKATNSPRLTGSDIIARTRSRNK